MKVYRMEKSIVLVGKAWEVRAKLKEYGRTFRYVGDWIARP
ncbi:cell division protein [Bacillus nakamurai]|uniref:Cell division protein n=1 Tax=Bacillus nakamurai TaxID=1793963 RepID=A0A150F8M3_9BACI|nr:MULTISPECIES: Z-ring formation inhibitor MciZ [Bacillus]KXZ21501.1 cell division protein [Bacillus nakamurai]KXZ21925.1 cell division protein [Bacillus nakamurai]MBY8913593.1 Z-ring formation inhibitor MciZ [Bacillus sp. YC2]MCC9021117.1 Z-ring formation inhibitor MciZ [Bacillus nakamurai]MCP6681173.1 Z-ring formation inhibitor MciZ [Bacillus nakamurai]